MSLAADSETVRCAPIERLALPSLTRDDVEACIHVWQMRLGLNWKVDVKWDEQPRDDAEAEFQATMWYDEATMRVRADYVAWSREKLSHVVCHELLHAVARDLHETVSAIEPHVAAPSTWELFDSRVTHELEGVIDRVAFALVGGWGNA